jgi:tight adherence protein C
MVTALRRPGIRRPAVADRCDEAVALTADLLAVAVAAGLTPFLAVQLAADFSPEAVARGLRAVVAAATDGMRLAEALDDEAGRNRALAPLLAILGASERSGAPAGPALSRLSATTRARARRRAMARARTVPVRLLFPLVFLVLPAFLVLTVAPVVLAGLR